MQTVSEHVLVRVNLFTSPSQTEKKGQIISSTRTWRDRLVRCLRRNNAVHHGDIESAPQRSENQFDRTLFEEKTPLLFKHAERVTKKLEATLTPAAIAIGPVFVRTAITTVFDDAIKNLVSQRKPNRSEKIAFKIAERIFASLYRIEPVEESTRFKKDMTTFRLRTTQQQRPSQVAGETQVKDMLPPKQPKLEKQDVEKKEEDTLFKMTLLSTLIGLTVGLTMSNIKKAVEHEDHTFEECLLTLRRMSSAAEFASLRFNRRRDMNAWPRRVYVSCWSCFVVVCVLTVFLIFAFATPFLTIGPNSESSKTNSTC